jgi:hypothetical protein
LARYSQIKKKEKFNLKFVDLFIDARARTTILFWLHNIYQRQS